MRKHGRTGAALTIAAALLAVGLGSFVILAGLAHYKTVAVAHRWIRTLGTREQILARYPPREANAAALTLERLSARLGIDTVPRSVTMGRKPRTVGHREQPTEEQEKAFSDFRAAASSYGTAQLERARRGIDAPPASVAAYLESHEAEIEAVRRHLTSGHVPYWEARLERLHEASMPNLIGNMNVVKLLVTDALAKAHAGQHGTGFRDLDAAWTMARALGDEPILIGQRIAIADVKLIAGALRQLGDPPPFWRDRLAEHDFRGSFMTALEYEGWTWTQRPDVLDGLGGVAGKLAGNVARPYFRLCLAHTSDEFRRRLKNLENVPALCDYDLSTRQADLAVPISRWDRVSGLVAGDFAGALDRLARLELDLELTAKLLELDQARSASGGWPASSPSIEASRACPRDRWMYLVTPEGEMTLAFGRRPTWPGVEFKGIQLPTAFTVSGGAPS